MLMENGEDIDNGDDYGYMVISLCYRAFLQGGDVAFPSLLKKDSHSFSHAKQTAAQKHNAWIYIRRSALAHDLSDIHHIFAL